MQMIVGVMVVACGVVGAITNRRFGHPTFFRGPMSSKQRPSELGGGSGRHHREAPRRSGLAAAVGIGKSGAGNKNRSGHRLGCGLGFDSIPPGVIEHILSFSSPAELVGAAPVCRDVCRASESELLWRALYVRYFGEEAALAEEAWRRQRRNQIRQSGEKGSERKGDVARRREQQTNRQRQRELGELPSADVDGRIFLDHNGALGRRGSSSARTATGGGIKGQTTDNSREHSASPVALSEPLCRRQEYTWRDAFFDAHFARPQELLKMCSSPFTCLIVVGGRVHDLTEFLPRHPGGEIILREHAFTDATVPFERFFHSREARRMAEQFVVWDGEAVMGRKGTLCRVAGR